MRKGLLTGLLTLALGGGACAAGAPYGLAEEEGLYVPVADVPLASAEGDLRLSQLYARQPVLLALVFTRCTGICSPFLLQLGEHLRALDPREKFRVVVVSFDPRDSPADMERYARLFNLGNDGRWLFATTDQIDALTASVGFPATWDGIRQQFDHEAMLVAVNGNGYIMRKMTGLRGRKDMASMIRTLGGGFLPSYPLPGWEGPLSCFTYDPVTGVRKPAYGLLVLLVPAALTLILVAVAGSTGRKERLRES